MSAIAAIAIVLIPEQPKETWQQIEEQLRRINQVLQALKSEPDDVVNKRLLQQVILLSGLIGTLNMKLRPQ